MEYWILLRANLKRHKSGVAGIFILTLLIAAALGAVLSVWINSKSYINSEINRAGFGDITAWVSGVPDTEKLADSIASLPQIESVEIQSLIFSNYTVNEQESDSEGQLITYVPEENRYRFFTDDLASFRQDVPDIRPGEVYISPALISVFGVQLGDEIIFPVARNGNDIRFTVKGFYEDPFMGSSMIGMKGFLICESDRTEILNILQNAGIDALAKDGAMYHIFSSAVGKDGGSGQITVSELNSIINDNTQLTQYTEFVYSNDLISGFMLILQNAFSALLLAFVIVLLVVAAVSLSHSISAEIEADTKNVGILKTVGLTSGRLQKIQLLQYLTAIVPAMILGLILAYLLARLISSATITTIGVRIPAKLPVFECVLSFALILLLFVGFITACSWKINRITPMTAICTGTENIKFNTKKMISTFGKAIYLRLAIRQLVTGRKRYIGSLAVAVILVFFASLVGRMNSWLGSDGKGMMDAFNPADHDIGVQVFGNLTADEAEKIILSYTDITDTYLLAMPGVAVNGIDYTANVISEPERFHIIEGRTCFADNEIVLTEFVAANFGVSIGDIVTVRGDIGSGEYIVSGIYSCANDMGDNVGMSREGYLKIGSDNPHIWCHHYFLVDTSKKTAVTQNLEALYGGDVHVHENTWPGLFGIIAAMHALIVFMYGMVIAFILIVTAMTGGKVLSAEQKALGIYKAIGFKTKNLRLTFALRFGLVAVLGSIIGTCVAAALTDSLVSAVMKLAGISNFYSSPAPGEIILPSVIVTALFFCFAYVAAGKIKRVNLTELIAEM